MSVAEMSSPRTFVTPLGDRSVEITSGGRSIWIPR